jgi:ppGpp synthetase/RelA/SpoT-type nucleotidyltranferase
MKVDRLIREAYAEQYRLNELLRAEVDAIAANADEHWHYEGRLKSEESFTLKVEAGRCDSRLRVEDFFGCTIVVQNVTQISKAKEFVASSFDIKYQKPASAGSTERRPTDFSFDDLRMYVTAKSVDYVPPKEYTDVIFEVQIKTFLQHAWAVATHDLTYKNDAIDWAKVRIAHEIRAMLEHAELSIEQVERLAESASIHKEYPEYTRIMSIINLVRANWAPEQLPRDLLRLARNVDRALSAINIPVIDLEAALAKELSAGRGAALANLSPYGVVMQTILNSFTQKISTARGPRTEPITVSSQIEIPASLGTLNKRHFRII